MLKSRSFNWSSKPGKRGMSKINFGRSVLAINFGDQRTEGPAKEARINEIQQATSSPSFYLTLQVGR